MLVTERLYRDEIGLEWENADYLAVEEFDSLRGGGSDLWRQTIGLGRLRLLHPPGNEGRARLLRRDDASAARGILEAIHWKPAIRWIVKAIHVLKPIRFQSIRRNEVGHKAPVASIRKAMNPATSAISSARRRRPPAARGDRARRRRLCDRGEVRADRESRARRQRRQASRIVQPPRPQGAVLPSALPRDARVPGEVSPDRARRDLAAGDRTRRAISASCSTTSIMRATAARCSSALDWTTA